MRFAVQLPTDRVQLGAEYGTAQAVMEMARVAEECGYHAVSVTEHPIPEDEWMHSGGHHALDPFVALAFAAAATEELRLLTNNPSKRAGLEGYGLEVVERIALQATPNKHNVRYLETKRAKMGHML